MPQPNVILIGASVRSFAQSALRDGIFPVCVDMFCDADLRTFLQDYGLRDAFWCRQIASFAEAAGAVVDVDPNVPVIVLGGLENHEVGFRQLLAQRTVIGPDWDTIEQLRNPQCLSSKLRVRGCRLPGFVVKGQSPPDHRPGMRWLRKDRRSAGGQGIRWYVEADRSWQTPSQTVRVEDLQEFIEGIPISASFFAAARLDHSTAAQDGAVLLGCVLQLCGCRSLHAAEFHFCGNVGPLKLSAGLRKQVADAGNAVTAAWPVAGVFGIDFVVRDGRAFVVEVNPRPTASHELHEFAHPGVAGHVSLQLGRWAPQFLSATDVSHGNIAAGGLDHQDGTPGCWARFVVYADQEVLVSSEMETEMLNYSATDHGAGAQSYRLADIPCAGSTIPAGAPLCSVYADISAKDQCFSGLLPLLNSLPLALVPSVSELVETIQAQLVVLVDD